LAYRESAIWPMRWFKAAGVLAAFAFGLVAVGLVFPLTDHWLPGTDARGRLQVCWFRALCRILGVSAPSLPVAGTGGRLWVANHVSWLDVVVLGARAPLTFVAKSEIAAWPVVGFLARRTGVLFVERGRPSRSGGMVAAMAERLRRGETLLLFPEGTTTRGGQAARFHSSLFQAALDTAVPVQPVAISYAGPGADHVPFVGDDAFVPHLWRLLGAGGVEARLAWGCPLAGDTERDVLARQARERVSELLEQGRAAACLRPETLADNPAATGCLAS
jgi:1-acyl-sn-glycerol-3-phosphate acyltransferase